jgi:hypothetical protein
MTTRKGKLLNNENFCGMIENLGDAYEAAEECFGMVWWLAARWADDVATDPVSRELLLDIIARAEANYREGLAEGGVQRSR